MPVEVGPDSGTGSFCLQSLFKKEVAESHQKNDSGMNTHSLRDDSLLRGGEGPMHKPEMAEVQQLWSETNSSTRE